MSKKDTRKAPPSIYIKSSEAEKEWVKSIARMYDLSVSELIRRALQLVEKEQPPLVDVAEPSHTQAYAA